MKFHYRPNQILVADEVGISSRETFIFDAQQIGASVITIREVYLEDIQNEYTLTVTVIK